MMKKYTLALLVTIGMFFIPFHSVLASHSTNPPVAEVKQVISDEAREQGIPPEVLKAIASGESNYKQFDDKGEPIISSDGGIGIMQVTPGNVDISIDEERLKTDIKYNISIGAKVLHSKWGLSYLPKMNTHDKSVLENWYFAIMAYNGLSKANDPNINPGNTYQEKVYERIEGASLLYGSEQYFVFPVFDMRYEKGNDTIFFAPNKDYETKEITLSQQMYVKGDIVYIDERDGSVNLREGSTNAKPNEDQLWPYTPLTITGEPVESSGKANDYAFYEVQGVEADGYVASAYLNKGSEDLVFNDSIDDNRAAALAFAAKNGYVRGYPGGNLFGSNDMLKRGHVAVILDNILSLTAPDHYKMVADDVKGSYAYYEQLRKAEYNQLLGGGGKLRPEEYLTRAQMAQVMTDAFADYYDTPETSHTFKDQKQIWNPGPVNTIYSNKVTVADPFLPAENITRSQFVIFLFRTMVDY